MNITKAITYPFRRLGRAFSSARNFAFSNAFLASMGRPIFNSWTISKAVKEGYKANGWVYRAVNLTAKSGSSVPWGVVNIENEFLPDHHLTKLMQRPNPRISRQKLFELWISWLELGGNGMGLKTKAGGKTVELWPVSPDRIHPVASKDISEWIAGYSLDTDITVKWLPEEILHFLYMDPANPLIGIGPLQAAGATVDVDTDQKAWNKAAMQNQGVLSGIFAFKREFDSQKDADDIAESINARYSGSSNARSIGVVGSEAKYYRTGATAQELDFGESRKGNRDEIFIIFGIPIQYAGATEASTYNNYQTSELIFWFQKIIPLLDNLKDTMNMSFGDELAEGETITYFLDDIDAIRRAMFERARTAKLLFSMGVPFNRLNKVFRLNIEEYEGWDKSYPSSSQAGDTGTDAGTNAVRAMGAIEDASASIESIRGQALITTDGPRLAIRDLKQEALAREEWAIQHVPDIQDLLSEQNKIINTALEDAAKADGTVGMIDPETLLADTWSDDWAPVYDSISKGYAVIAADQVAVSTRADGFDALDEILEQEKIILTELSLIEKSTVEAILVQVRGAIAEGLTVNELQQSIMDAGIFEPARALRLSRTITGTAGSVGQLFGAGEVGATHKKWLDSGFEVRPEHVERNNESAVKIDELFSPKFGALTGPRYPLDQNMPAADRINCRCAMSFQIN